MNAARRPRGHRMIVRRVKSLQLGAPLCRPFDAVLLTIDAAKTSGVALYLSGSLRSYAEVKADDHAARDRVVRDAVTTAVVRGLPVACVIESSFGGFASAAMSLASTVKLWRDSWLRERQHEARFFEITVGEWRRALFGRAGMSRTAARQLEAQVAHTAARRDLPNVRHWTIGHDACAAICIGQVMVRSSGLRDALQP